ncbi:hypothetical protein BYZ73_20205 [Rhodovulum viride]|uniref:pEK499-p136 HEPN domain-containing protein n=1 Tax=Rhodovulum viride TaxID=1231134 RepID=A0ABX9DAY4_9RHOB|nr:hypothetical protein [Rhodovulum viride]RAP39495.1 hypothetical protein BYZ73_20205 [Rhodovulum viride]
MGNPQHYSVELPCRCLALINGLWHEASKLHGEENPELGPLTSTFLVSMSMPILTIPLERVERQIGKAEDQAYADDRHLGPKAADAFVDVIRKGKLGEAAFYKEGAWRFVSVRKGPFPNIASGLPEDLAEALSGDDAVEAARAMEASQWVSILRNAMAHGGIAYLDETGRSSHGTPAKMFAFVSGKYAKPKCQHAEANCRFGMGKLEGLNILRISETDYRQFLEAWVAWLGATKIAKMPAA